MLKIGLDTLTRYRNFKKVYMYMSLCLQKEQFNSESHKQTVGITNTAATKIIEMTTAKVYSTWLHTRRYPSSFRYADLVTPAATLWDNYWITPTLGMKKQGWQGGYSHTAPYSVPGQGLKTKPCASRVQALNHFVILSLCLGKCLSITLQLRSYLIFTVTVPCENMIYMS